MSDPKKNPREMDHSSDLKIHQRLHQLTLIQQETVQNQTLVRENLTQIREAITRLEDRIKKSHEEKLTQITVIFPEGPVKRYLNVHEIEAILEIMR